MDSIILGDDRSSIVVSHDMFWTNHYIVSRFYRFALRQADCIPLNDLFNNRLWRPAWVDSGRKVPRVGEASIAQSQTHPEDG
jgi:hypothetical protein